MGILQNTEPILLFGMIAASLQALGYLTYVVQVLRSEIRPNAASWTMFAYGTSVLVVLEWDRGADIALLVLPTICAISSISVALYCKARGGKLWPNGWFDRTSFLLDVTITIVYIAGWMLLKNEIITGREKDLTDLVLLICWNAGVLTAFSPLLRDVYKNPHIERALPWVIWTLAYGLLAVVTLVQRDGVDELLLYPLVNMLVHGFVAYHSRSQRRKAHA